MTCLGCHDTTGLTDLGGPARSTTNQIIPPQPSRDPPHVASRHELGVDLAARDVGASNATSKSPTRVLTDFQEHHLRLPFKQFVRRSVSGSCRHALAHHTTSACQPGKKEGAQGSLIECGLEYAEQVQQGGWKFQMQMPNLATPDDGRAWTYEAIHDQRKKKSVENEA